MSDLEFGVNLNNREPLIAPDYDLQMLLDLSEVVEFVRLRFRLGRRQPLLKPRYEPISLLAAISQRTSRVRLGTACMVSSTRNPLYLALEWATLDQISGGRTIFGTGWGIRRKVFAESSRRSASTTCGAARSSKRVSPSCASCGRPVQ